MNIKTLIVSCFLCTPIFAQQVDTTGLSAYFKYFVPNNLRYEFQNWEYDKHLFPPGVYYQFLGRIELKDGKKHYTNWTIINKPEMLIGFLIGKGIPIREVWYKESERNCHDLQVVIPASLLIRTAKEMPEDVMNVFGFEKTEQVSPGGCPYNILHYMFE